jgi:hypothetical protein
VAEQKFGPARSADGLVADRERLVEQHAAGRERRAQRGKERTPEVVGDDDRVEAAAAERPRAVLEVGGDRLGDIGERRHRRRHRGRSR